MDRNSTRPVRGFAQVPNPATPEVRLDDSPTSGNDRHMAMPALKPNEVAARFRPEALTSAACLFRGFSDVSRLSILRHLTTGEHRVVDLVDHLGLAQSTVSKHLACLRDCGLVDSRPQGRSTRGSLTCPEELMALLAAADRILTLTDDAGAVCPMFGAKPGQEAS